MKYRQKPVAPGEIPPLPLNILKEFNTLKTLVLGRLKNKQNKLPKELLESVSGEELTILAFKFIIENKIFAIDSLSLGIKYGYIKDYASFCRYYDIRHLTEEEETMEEEAPELSSEIIHFGGQQESIVAASG